jgi:DNA adenine methylase
MSRIKPFLKWAGGKRWLTANYDSIFYQDYDNYIEPFLGSGAVYFHLLPEKGILSDINKNLIDTYKAIQISWREVVEQLKDHHSRHSDDYYYLIRSTEFQSRIERAAQFIYLNRTCWNGLYRVNKAGKFNVPKGTKSKVLLEDDDFEEVSKNLKKMTIRRWDFEKAIDRATENDLLFIDPPYTVKHNFNGFVKYNENIFSWQDQIRLSEALIRAKDRGVHIIATNAFHESVRNLYDDHFFTYEVKRNSSISGQSEYRGKYEELLIRTCKTFSKKQNIKTVK